MRLTCRSRDRSSDRSADTTRILLADDHALVRRGLRLILDGEPDLQVVAEAGDGAEAVERPAAGDVDLAILDIAMPRMTGPAGRAGAVPARARRCGS